MAQAAESIEERSLLSHPGAIWEENLKRWTHNDSHEKDVLAEH